MGEGRFLNDYELGEIIRRYELANGGNPLRDLDVLNAMYASLDDIPKLLSERNELRNRIDEAEGLLEDASDLIDDMYPYETKTYGDIMNYLAENKPITRRDE